MRAHFNLTETKVITKLHKKFIRLIKNRSQRRHVIVESSVTFQSMPLSTEYAHAKNINNEKTTHSPATILSSSSGNVNMSLSKNVSVT
jgi:hypothetical protein